MFLLYCCYVTINTILITLTCCEPCLVFCLFMKWYMHARPLTGHIMKKECININRCSTMPCAVKWLSVILRLRAAVGSYSNRTFDIASVKIIKAPYSSTSTTINKVISMHHRPENANVVFDNDKLAFKVVCVKIIIEIIILKNNFDASSACKNRKLLDSDKLAFNVVSVKIINACN